MTKTAYASRLSAEEVSEQTKDMSPEDREEFRVENALNPLFDMWLRFEAAFADRAIDRLDITDEDAEAGAKLIEKNSGPAGAAFAHLLRRIPKRRLTREMFHKVSAVWAASGKQEGMSIKEVYERYEKLPKGEA